LLGGTVGPYVDQGTFGMWSNGRNTRKKTAEPEASQKARWMRKRKETKRACITLFPQKRARWTDEKRSRGYQVLHNMRNVLRSSINTTKGEEGKIQ